MPLSHKQQIIAGSVLTLAAIAFVAIGLATRFAMDWLDPFDDTSFTTAAWTTLTPNSRAPMARDLIRNHLPSGLSRAQTEALLGAPDDILSGVDSGGNRLRGTETYSYSIGSWSMHGFDDAFVYVYLDSNGNVIGSEINGY